MIFCNKKSLQPFYVHLLTLVGFLYTTLNMPTVDWHLSFFACLLWTPFVPWFQISKWQPFICIDRIFLSQKTSNSFTYNIVYSIVVLDIPLDGWPGEGVVGYIYIGIQAKIKKQKKHMKLDIYINRWQLLWVGFSSECLLRSIC